jgi:hypothetical protein
MTSNLYKRLSYLLFGALVIFILLTFKQYGISNDEQVQHVYGQLLLKFYSSGFSDQSAFVYKNLYLYGGFFDLVVCIVGENCTDMGMGYSPSPIRFFWIGWYLSSL